MTVRLSPLAGAGWQLFDDSGIPLAGGKIYTYTAGSSTPQATYTTSAGNIAHTNPIVLDANGRVPNEVWLTQGIDYKFIIKTSAEVLIGTYDNLQGINDIQAQITAIEAGIFADLADTSNVAKGDALIGFKQANMAGVYTGAVGQTVHRKLQERVSVFDFMTTVQINDVQAGTSLIDVRSAVNAAFTAVINNGGGTLYFPKGTYYVSDSVGNTDYAGVTASINIQVDAEPGAVLNCNPSVFANVALFLRFQNLNVGIVKNLKVNCNNKVSTGIFVTSAGQSQAILVDNCEVNDCFGIDNAGATTSVFGISTSSALGYACSITNCRIFNVRRAKQTLSCQALCAVGFITTWVENNTVFNVRHDGTALQDADGIVVFSYLDPSTSRYYRPSAATIINNRIFDCEGRFIKLQTHGATLVENNTMTISGAIELIQNFQFIDSQVAQATIINNKFEAGDSWTGGGSSTVASLQIPAAGNPLLQSNEPFVQKFCDNEIYIRKIFAYGLTMTPFAANVASKNVADVCGNKVFRDKTMASTDMAVASFISFQTITPVGDVTGQTIWNIANNQVSAENFIGLGSGLTRVDYTGKWWMYVYNNVKFGDFNFLIRNTGSSPYDFPYTSNVMIRDNQMGTTPTQVSDLFGAPINSALLINGSDFSTGDSSAGTISPAPAVWRDGHFGRKGGVLFAETVSGATAYRYLSRDNGANWYQV
jgi:hypothetical protein